MFNTEARWDRKFPAQQKQKDAYTEIIDEPITVGCLFTNTKPRPRYFIWRNRLYRVQRVNFFWQNRQGRGVISYFSLKTNRGTYQVRFSNESLCWKLNKVLIA